VPLEAVTMGLGTLREARAVRLVATGASKRAALAGALACRWPAVEHPASWLADHPDLRVWCDRDALGPAQS
jgi:glucosamine-6-phosphate deaminase